jgi:hypothetical protein
MVNGPLFIPANTTKTFWSTLTTPVKGTLISVFPHMHLLGKSIKVWGFAPGSKDTIPIIDIPEWDFHWQGDYMFQKPLVIEAGTQLWVEATYDNTANNPENPNRPPKNVRLGEGTADEMLLVYFGFLVPSFPGDASVVIDTSTTRNYVQGCEGLLSTFNTPLSHLKLELFPNPAADLLRLRTDMNPAELRFECTDVLGRKWSTPLVKLTHLDVSALPKGLYFLSIYQEGQLIKIHPWMKE